MKSGHSDTVARDRSELDGLLKSAFADDRFDKDKWVRKHFLNGSEEQLRQLFTELQKKKEVAAHALQNNVFHNYPRFISTSKEIQSMEEDMLEVRNMMTKCGGILKTLEGTQVTSQAKEGIAKPGLATKQPTGLAGLADFSDEGVPLDDLLSELDVYIGERRYREASDLLQRAETIVDQHARLDSSLGKGRKANELQKRIEKQRQQLARLLMHDLKSPALHKSEHRLLITCLLNLGLPLVARDLFLDARSERIRADIRKLQFDGDLVKHVEELSRIVFTTIAASCDEFRAHFPDSSLSSGLVVWAVEEVSKFAQRLKRVVFASNDFHAMARCVHVAMLFSKITEDKGLALGWKLWTLFSEELLASLQAYAQRIRNALSNQVANENWVARMHWVYDSSPEHDSTAANNNTETDEHEDQVELKLSESGKYLYSSLQAFADNAALVLHPSMVNKVASMVCATLVEYLKALAQQLKSPSLNDKQVLAILVNCRVAVHRLLPNVLGLFYAKDQEQTRARSATVELAIEKAEKRVWNSFANTRADNIVFEKLKWNETDYSSSSVDVEGPSGKFVRLYEYLKQLTEWIADELDPACATPIASAIMSHIVVRLASRDTLFWAFEKEQDSKSAKFGAGGIQQFIVDQRYLMQFSARFKCGEEVNTSLMEMIQRAVIAYCRSSGSEPQTIIKADEWYAQRTRKGLTAEPSADPSSLTTSRSRERERDRDRERERERDRPGRSVGERSERDRREESQDERSLSSSSSSSRKPGLKERTTAAKSTTGEKKKRISKSSRARGDE